MPEEIFRERNWMADDSSLAKVLFHDIAWQLRAPITLASIDASNCHDRVAHAIGSLVFQAFGVLVNVAVTMLHALYDMQFFLWTAFEDSETALGSTIYIKMKGLCQSNCVVLAGLAIISTNILCVHEKKDHGLLCLSYH